ncbi:MAG TPA: hypothetical protein VIY73_22145, partial [Polyangiaceae bacterium]
VPAGLARHRGARLVAAAALGVLVVLSFLSLLPTATARSATAMQAPNAPTTAALVRTRPPARASAVTVAVDADSPAQARPAVAGPTLVLASTTRVPGTPPAFLAPPTQPVRVVASASVAAAPSKAHPSDRSRRAVDLKALYDRRL